MLKKFFLNLLSSFLGAWIALVGFGVLAVFVIIGLIAKFGASNENVQSLSRHSILKISLKGQVEENEKAIEFNYMQLLQGKMEKAQTLQTLVKSIEEASENKNIDAIYLECGGLSAGLATADRLRKALMEFKKSGKKIYAYGDAYGTTEYFIASCADSLFLNENGNIDLQGISGNVPYFKGLLDKLGVQFQVVKVGTFKSAVEPYILEDMSAPARAQLDTLYGNIWQYMKAEMANSRKLKPTSIDQLVNRDFIAFAEASECVKARLADKAVSAREMDNKLADLAGVEKKKLNIVSPQLLISGVNLSSNSNSRNQIAVLYATGEISENDNSGINCKNLVPVIVKLAEDDNVKGLVMRVNSPGGSVFGSSEIAEALQYFLSKKKTFAVSMGDYAASGGYWISADAQRIFSDPLTVTGSIGIFGMIPNVKGLADKLGVNMVSVSTDPEADFPSLFRPMTDKQLSVMQKYIDHGYDRFIKRVAKGRKMSESKVRSIAEGRVWDGITAKKIGLVDQLGTLEDAVKWTADKAGVKDSYNVCYYPEIEFNIWNYIPDKATMTLVTSVKDKLGNSVSPELTRHAIEILSRKPAQARMIPLDLGRMN